MTPETIETNRPLRPHPRVAAAGCARAPRASDLRARVSSARDDGGAARVRAVPGGNGVTRLARRDGPAVAPGGTGKAVGMARPGRGPLSGGVRTVGDRGRLMVAGASWISGRNAVRRCGDRVPGDSLRPRQRHARPCRTALRITVAALPSLTSAPARIGMPGPADTARMTAGATHARGAARPIGAGATRRRGRPAEGPFTGPLAAPPAAGIPSVLRAGRAR